MQRMQPELVIRRRANLPQGRALETLGHAVEYLLDCRLFLADEQAERSSEEAVALLMGASRAVFAECAEVVPVRRRLGRWMSSRLPGRLLVSARGRAAGGVAR